MMLYVHHIVKIIIFTIFSGFNEISDYEKYGKWSALCYRDSRRRILRERKQLAHQRNSSNKSQIQVARIQVRSPRSLFLFIGMSVYHTVRGNKKRISKAWLSLKVTHFPSLRTWATPQSTVKFMRALSSEIYLVIPFELVRRSESNVGYSRARERGKKYR